MGLSMRHVYVSPTLGMFDRGRRRFYNSRSASCALAAVKTRG